MYKRGVVFSKVTHLTALRPGVLADIGWTVAMSMPLQEKVKEYEAILTKARLAAGFKDGKWS